MENTVLGTKNIFSHKNILILIIGVAFLIRIAGIGYGLPLWLIGDEPSLITGALKMIELKTVLPFLHTEELKPTLYFPPYMSYFYMPFFAVLIGFKYLFFSGGMSAFKDYLVSDLSAFFILARIINAIIGTATVYLVYKISKNIFKEEIPALLGATFLALSTLHAHLSSVGRDWIPATFLFVLGIYLLTNSNISFKNRYLIGAIISGIAFGVSLIGGFIMVFMLCWYLFYEKHSLLDIFKEKILYYALTIFLALATTSFLIYPFGFHLRGDNTVKIAKPLGGLIVSSFNFLKPVFCSEPILIIAFILGLIFSYKKYRRFFWATAIFILSYTSIFYLIYFYYYRYTIYLFPILAIMAGYGLCQFMEKFQSKTAKTLLLLTLLIPLASTFKLDYLAINNDSRTQAIQWTENNIPAESKIIVYGNMMRIHSMPKAIKEQELIDSSSLRQVDYAEMNLKKNDAELRQFYALNLYTMNSDFFRTLEDYAVKNNYQYLILGLSKTQKDKERMDIFQKLTQKGEVLETFGNENYDNDFTNGSFDDLIKLFKEKSAGPLIQIYKLNLDQLE